MRWRRLTPETCGLKSVVEAKNFVSAPSLKSKKKETRDPGGLGETLERGHDWRERAGLEGEVNKLRLFFLGAKSREKESEQAPRPSAHRLDRMMPPGKAREKKSGKQMDRGL